VVLGCVPALPAMSRRAKDTSPEFLYMARSQEPGGRALGCLGE
jgi:hypothetical protein